MKEKSFSSSINSEMTAGYGYAAALWGWSLLGMSGWCPDGPRFSPPTGHHSHLVALFVRVDWISSLRSALLSGGRVCCRSSAALRATVSSLPKGNRGLIATATEELHQHLLLVMDEGLTEASEASLGCEDANVASEESCYQAATAAGDQSMSGECQKAVGSKTTVPRGRGYDDDDVVLAPGPKVAEVTAAAPSAPNRSEPIVIDDEEDPAAPPRSLSSTEPDSEIRIASVTTLGSAGSQAPPAAVATSGSGPGAEQRDMNLMIMNVTSLQDAAPAAGGAVEVEKGLQISSTFSLNPEAQEGHGECPAGGRPTAHSGSSGTFNPGRVSTAREPVQNGETGTHQKPDSWISQSASFPRNQKQPGADSPSPAAPLPKPPVRSPLGSQPTTRAVKVTCANCKKPLKKGQTAYQRKGSAHLFCSTTCLSAFSHRPAPKKNCTMCKKDITTMKGTIVAQVDSSESFQEFCSTGCLASYENKQNPPKTPVKTKCTVCGNLTEIRHEVSFKNVTHKICSDMCFNRYRMANGLIMNCCEQCGDYLPSRASANHFLVIDGQQKRFCCQNCVRDYKQAHGKLTTCSGCKAPCRSFDVTHCIGPSGTMEPYCSTSCMTAHKNKATAVLEAELTCHYCKRNALPQYQATLPDGKVYSFCSSDCVTKFQSASLLAPANGEPAHSSTADAVQLKCNYCRGLFSLKPEILEWEDFARRLGLKCVTCNYCSQMCKRGIVKQVDGMQRDFCSESCSKKFHDWYYKAARCDCCKLQGNLLEMVHWRGEVKHFCDQQCLLRFYCQQNEPNMSTQKGPENVAMGYGSQSQGAKTPGYNQAMVPGYAGGGLLKDAKNKAVLCKPLTMTKATYCKPHMQSKNCQTEEPGLEVVKKEYVPVPIPVPVYVPVPMNLYAQTTPAPLTLPVPIPVPVFLPGTSGTNPVAKTQTPSDSAERTEMIAEEKPDREEVKLEGVEGGCVKDEPLKSESRSCSDAGEQDEEDEESADPYDTDLDLEDDLPQVPGLDPAADLLMAEISFSLPPILGEEKEDSSRPVIRRKGHKRRAAEEGSAPASPSGPTEDTLFPLKPRYGLNAWKRWVLTVTTQAHESKAELQEAKRARLKRNVLSLGAAELNHALSRFVSEVRRPSGDCYAPDCIFYLCLGIQQHLRENGRTDDIFGDPCYEQFGQALTKVLKGWQPSVLPDGSLWSRVEERCLWSCRLLGAHSPASLLRSLVYLNTKYFGLRTVEQHLRLSFGNVYGQRGGSPHACIRIPSISLERQVKTGSGKRKRKDEDEDGTADDDGAAGASRCPIKKHECHLYELYLSKWTASKLYCGRLHPAVLLPVLCGVMDTAAGRR
ncbi:zinc finger MYM-type protein 2-like [Scleropages formosus]|uniref:Zinc finger MYM-type protein 2-like n=1 Tax=Scleropages formosus TaxID=113540 RepID=A0A0P7X2D0_SCLFO|nr:zinc finger MYM-type protein 2-like [Scleropages formosus]